ncbi:MAG: DUF4054 domain-containing protein [Deltaproteobacteria bacterium]|nr:DUF4054 domain-containing protein [Deltaproteobacteria bacterium]
MPIGTAQEIIVAKSPSLSGDSRLDDFVNLAKLTVGQTIFGTRYQYALALVALHMLTLDSQSGGSSTGSGTGAAGGVKSEKEGDLQRSYGSVDSSSIGNASDAYFSTTSFGQEYLNLKKSLILPIRNRHVGNFPNY